MASVPTAWVLIEMFRKLPPIPKIKRHAINWWIDWAKPSIGSVIEYNSAANIAMYLLPKRATNQPAIGKEKRRPTGRLNNTAPNDALLRCSFSWISGILDAQLEKHKPVRKKKMLTLIRCVLLFGRYVVKPDD